MAAVTAFRPIAEKGSRQAMLRLADLLRKIKTAAATAEAEKWLKKAAEGKLSLCFTVSLCCSWNERENAPKIDDGFALFVLAAVY